MRVASIRRQVCYFLLLCACTRWQSNGTHAPTSDADVARAATGHVAFIRATPDHLVPTALGDAEATELWIEDADGSHPHRLVVGTAADSVEHSLAAFSSPRFSLDGRRLYFLSHAWVTSDAVHVVDVASGRESFVAPGNALEVILRGPFAGCLLVAQHRYRENGGGSSDSAWIIDPHGRTIALADASSDAQIQLTIWRDGRVPDAALQASHTAASSGRCAD